MIAKKKVLMRVVTFSLAFSMLVSSFTGCQQASASKSASSEASETASGSTSIKDAAGRTVQLPSKVSRALALHPVPTYLLWRLAPKKMVSVDTVFKMMYLSSSSTPYFNKKTIASLQKLPVTGTYFKGFDQEQIASLTPDVIFTLNTDTKADTVQKTLNIPYIEETKTPLDNYPAVIKQMGNVLKNQKEAAELASFWSSNLKTLKKNASKIAKKNKKKVLYVGKSGDILATPTKDTIFSADIDEAGGINLGDELNATGNESASINIEQILSWNPDVIIVATQSGKDQIMKSSEWSSLNAVKEGHVYVPYQFAGLDSIQSIMGAMWTQEILYHQNDASWHKKFVSTLRSYYKLFFDRTLSDSEVEEAATQL